MATTKQVASKIARISNVEFWNAARNYSPNFLNSTSKATKEFFNENTFEEMKSNNLNILNDFFKISMRVAFQMITRSTAKNPLSDIVVRYDTPFGGIQQRMAIHTMKPISPRFRGLKDGDSVDQYQVRLPKIEERFYRMNYDFQNLVTIQSYQMKEIFLSEFGMGEFQAGIMESCLTNSRIIQDYNNILQCIDTAILNSENFPMQDSQKIGLSINDTNNMTAEELTNMILAMKDVATSFETEAQTSAFNQAKFKTSVSADDMILLIRAPIKNRISTSLMVGAFNPDYLSLPFSEVIPVSNFGGLIPYKENTFTTQVYPAYDAKFGNVIGYNDQPDQTVAQYGEDEVFFKDPNENVLALAIQKGGIFECRQNGIEINAVPNYAGQYVNYWMSSPNNLLAWDRYYASIAFVKADA